MSSHPPSWLPHWLESGWNLLARLEHEIGDDQVGFLAAGLAFHAVLALFPGLIALVSFYGLFTSESTVRQQVSAVFDLMPPSAADLISGQMQSVTRASDFGLSLGFLIGLGGLLWTASSGVRALIRAVNLAFDRDELRGFITGRAVSMLFTLGAVVLAALTVTVVAVVPILFGPLGLSQFATSAISTARWPLLLAGTVLALAVLFRFAHHADRPPWRVVFPGAAVATVLWLLMSYGFSFFVANFGSYNETYGALGGFVVLLLWLYMGAFSVLLGAELSAVIAQQRAGGGGT